VTLDNVFFDGSVYIVCLLVNRLEYRVCCCVMGASKREKNVWTPRCRCESTDTSGTTATASGSGSEPERSRDPGLSIRGTKSPRHSLEEILQERGNTRLPINAFLLVSMLANTTCHVDTH
jgi:hypothetical protein